VPVLHADEDKAGGGVVSSGEVVSGGRDGGGIKKASPDRKKH